MEEIIHVSGDMLFIVCEKNEKNLITNSAKGLPSSMKCDCPHSDL